MAAFSICILFTATSKSTVTKRENIVAFTWQQWSTESAKILRNVYIAKIVTDPFSLPTEKNKALQVAIFGYMCLCFPQTKFWKIWQIVTKVSQTYAILAHL